MDHWQRWDSDKSTATMHGKNIRGRQEYFAPSVMETC